MSLISNMITFNKFSKLNFNNNNNYLKLLPYDIQIYIFKLYEDSACNIIIDKWYNHLNKKSLIKLLLSDLKSIYYKPNGTTIIIINYLSNNIINILEKCLIILSGKEDSSWLKLFLYIINSLQINLNCSIYEHKIFIIIESLISKILVKFDLFNNYYQALDNYHILMDIDEDSFNFINQYRHNGNIHINYDLNND